jgi:hypothetical protein
MQFPVWLKPALWGAVGGAIVLSIVGFSQLGWSTKKTADLMASDRAETAVVDALVPFCVAKAQHDVDHAGFLKIQAEQSAYTRSDLVMKAGWATLGDSKSPEYALARACSEKLHTMPVT